MIQADGIALVFFGFFFFTGAATSGAYWVNSLHVSKRFPIKTNEPINICIRRPKIGRMIHFNSANAPTILYVVQ